MSSPATPPFLAGLGLCATLIVAIGAQNLFVLQQGLRGQRVWQVAATCSLLDLLLMGLGVAGVGALIGQRPELLRLLSWAGAALLAVYALQAWHRAWRPRALDAGAGAELGALATLRRTLAISLLNPHVYLDTVVLVGAVGAGQSSRVQFLAGAASASLLWFFALALGARLLAPLFARPAAWRLLDLLVGATLLALSLSLLD